MITDSGTKRSPVMERDAAELGRTLELFRERFLFYFIFLAYFILSHPNNE